MDLSERIRRRKGRGEETRLVLDYQALNPIAHLAEPIGRGPVLERLLDYLDPVFDGDLPPDAYVWGPPGAGKSAVLTALFSGLSATLSRSQGVIHTATRARTPSVPRFVYVDAREADTDFGLYHAVLDAILDEPAPRQGVGTDVIRSRLVDRLRSPDETALVAVDHVGEPGTRPPSEVAEAMNLPTDSVSWLAVGRAEPDELSSSVRPPEHVEVPRYEEHALVDVLTGRASDGLAGRAVGHEQLRRVAEWAEGDAHRALSALFGAADLATTAGHERILERDVDDGIEAVPLPAVSLGRVFTLPGNRKRVLRELIELEEDAGRTVGETAEVIAGRPGVDLTPSTVERFLYELAEDGIVERVRTGSEGGAGRPPSRIEPRFPTIVFRRLFDLDER